MRRERSNSLKAKYFREKTDTTNENERGYNQTEKRGVKLSDKWSRIIEEDILRKRAGTESGKRKINHEIKMESCIRVFRVENVKNFD